MNAFSAPGLPPSLELLAPPLVLMQAMALREIELGKCTVNVSEDLSLSDDAGVVVWDAALVLAYYLGRESERNPDFLAGKHVIDIGCGTGVAGLCAAALGAGKVILTDLPHLLPLVERNIQLNDLQQSASAAALRWGDPVETFQPPFDLVLASDLFYQAASLPSLLTTLRALSGPGTLLLASVEHRPLLPFPREQLEAEGFAVEDIPRRELHPEWSSEDITVYRLTLRRR